MGHRVLSHISLAVLLAWGGTSLSEPLYEHIPAPSDNPESCPHLLAAFDYTLKNLREAYDPDHLDELRDLLHEPEIAADPQSREQIERLIRYAMEDQRMADEVQAQYPAVWRDIENQARKTARALVGDMEYSPDALFEWKPPGEFSIETDGADRLKSLLPPGPDLPIFRTGFLSDLWNHSGANLLADLVYVRAQQLIDTALVEAHETDATAPRRNLLVGRQSRVDSRVHVVLHQTKSLQALTAELLSKRPGDEPVLVIPNYAYHERLTDEALAAQADLVRPFTLTPGLHPALRLDADHIALYGGDFNPWSLSSELHDLIKSSLESRREIGIEMRLEAMYGLMEGFVRPEDAAEFKYEMPTIESEEYEEWDPAKETEDAYLARMDAIVARLWAEEERLRYQNVRALGPWIARREPAERKRLLRRLATYLIDRHMEESEFALRTSSPSERSFEVRLNYRFLFSDEEKTVRFLFSW